MTHEAELAAALDKIWEHGNERNWILGRLGVEEGADEDIDVAGRPGYVVVSLGAAGNLGVSIARDRVGALRSNFQQVRMRRENGELVIREASAYAGGSGGGGGGSLAGLSDVTLSSPASGQALVYNGSQWVNLTGGVGMAEHDLSGSYHSGELNWDLISFTGSSLSDLADHAHSSLSGIGPDQHHDHVTVGNGLKLATEVKPDSQHMTIDLALDPGLEFSAGKLRVKEYYGLTRDGNGIGLKLLSGMTALTVDANGLAIHDDIAGNGLGINSTTKIMSVNVSNGLEIVSDNVRVNQAFNFAWTGVHTFADDVTFNDPVILNDNGTFNTGVFIFNTAPQVNANVHFFGGNRSITATNNLTLSPTTDLILDPTGLIVLPDAQELRTATIQDLPTGIHGLRLWDRGSNYRQLTMGAGKFDELYVRVFVADEVRIDRGEEYWSKSYGIVETDFTMPALLGEVNVWFENSPALANGPIFAVNDWLLLLTIDWDTGLVIERIWFRATALVTAGSVDGYRQQWTIRRRSGGTTGTVVKKGNTLLDTGVIGQGWIHLSALQQDGGPFIQVGKMTSVVSDVPTFTNYARFGNLNGTVDYTTDAYGLAAGSLLAPEGIGATPSSGFSGFTVDGTQGLRLFNTELLMYEGGTLKTKLDIDDGLIFAWDTNLGDDWGRYVRWHDNVLAPSATDHAMLGAYIAGTDRILAMRVVRSTPNPILLLESEKSGVGSSSLSIYHNRLEVQSGNTFAHLSATGLLIAETFFATGADSILHLYEDSGATGLNAGVTIEQNGTGDARLAWVLSESAVVTYSMGIDNTDDSLKISRSATLGTSNILTANSSGTTIRAGGSSGLRLEDDAGNLGIFIEDGGFVGMGLQTNPTTYLDILGDVNSSIGIKVENQNAGSSGRARGWFNSVASDAYFAFSLNSTTFWSFGVHVADTNFKLSQATNLGTNDFLSVTTAGNIGIGTNAPYNLLHIRDSAVAGSDSNVDDLLVVEKNGNAHINLIASAAGNGAIVFSDDVRARGYIHYAHATDVMSFYVAGALRQTIDDTGRIVVGALVGTPTAKVNIVNNLNEAIDNVHFYGYTAGNPPSITGRAAGGSYGAATGVGQNALLLAVNAAGMMSTGAYSPNQAYLRFYAAENWTATARGAYAAIGVTPIGGTAFEVGLQVNPNKAVSIPYAWAANAAVGAVPVYVGSDGILGKNPSSLRFKKDVADLAKTIGDEFVQALRPVTYRLKEDKSQNRYVGFIAEEVQAIGDGMGELFITRDDAGLVDSLRYESLIAPLVMGWQSHEARIAELEREIARLRAN